MQTAEGSEPEAPVGMHWPSVESRQLPFAQPTPPGQGAPNDSPHAPRRLSLMQQAAFVCVELQSEPTATHCRVLVRQQPCVQVFPAQHGSPGWPQAMQPPSAAQPAPASVHPRLKRAALPQQG
jgi:hypothetical protein